MSDYIELEYIESTGTQYIDLNYMTTSHFGFEIDVSISSNTGANLFGAGNGNSQYPYFNLRENLCRYSYGNGDYDQMITFCSTDYNSRHKFSFKYNTSFSNYSYYYDDTKVNDLALSVHPTNANLALFSFRDNNGNIRNTSEEVSRCKFYSLKLYESDVLTMDIIPIKRKSDNEVCLYDNVSNTFFTNQGTGNFIAGPEIPEPTLYENVSLINTQISNLKSLTDEILGTTPGPEIVPFATATDGQISDLLDAHYAGKIDLSKIWNIGDTRVIHINELTAPVSGSLKAHVAQDMTFRIIGFNHDNLTTPINNRTTAAVTIECREILGQNGSAETDYLSTDSNASSYSNPSYFDNAYRRTWLNSNFINALPSTFKMLVKEVVKRNIQGHDSTINYIETVDKAFLLSYPEIFNDTYQYYRGGAALNDYEGTQYEFYNLNNSTAGRKKYVNNNGSAGKSDGNYWLRSPASSFSSDWCYILNGQIVYVSYNSKRGLAPALAI